MTYKYPLQLVWFPLLLRKIFSRITMAWSAEQEQAWASLSTIPASIAQKILPHPKLSVSAFLRFPLPVVSCARTTHTPTQFFAEATPSIPEPAELLKHALSPHAMIQKIVEEAPLQFIQGKRSVIYAHHASHVSNYPIWVVTFWKEVARLRREIRQEWQSAEEWVINSRGKLKNDKD